MHALLLMMPLKVASTPHHLQKWLHGPAAFGLLALAPAISPPDLRAAPGRRTRAHWPTARR